MGHYVIPRCHLILLFSSSQPRTKLLVSLFHVWGDSSSIFLGSIVVDLQVKHLLGTEAQITGVQLSQTSGYCTLIRTGIVNASLRRPKRPAPAVQHSNEYTLN